jgi:hypothetical protein
MQVNLYTLIILAGLVLHRVHSVQSADIIIHLLTWDQPDFPGPARDYEFNLSNKSINSACFFDDPIFASARIEGALVGTYCKFFL